jgi:hypothetical protein
MDKPPEVPPPEGPNDNVDISNRIDQAEDSFGDHVGPALDNGDGTKKCILDTIPFEKDYHYKTDYIRYESNLAADKYKANRLDYNLPKGYKDSMGVEVKDIDMEKLGFQKAGENEAGSTWTKPVIK